MIDILFHRWIRIILVIIFVCALSCKKNPNDSPPEPIPFVIENLGVRFGPWDRQTNLAGDFYLTNFQGKIFGEFGAQTLDPDWNIKILPTMDFIIRKDAFICAISEGEVVRIYYQEESNDYDFSIRSLNDPAFDIVYDHMVNLRISLGDHIKPGDTLGNPRPFNDEIGFVEIMVNNLDTKLSYCPFCFFNEEKRDNAIQEVNRLMQDWETFKGDTTIYDQENFVIPGCRFESIVTY